MICFLFSLHAEIKEQGQHCQNKKEIQCLAHGYLQGWSEPGHSGLKIDLNTADPTLSNTQSQKKKKPRERQETFF